MHLTALRAAGDAERWAKAMRSIFAFAPFWCVTIALGEPATPASVVTACEIYSTPEVFDGREVEVVGRINVQFEHMSLVCLDRESKKAPLLFGVWLHLDLESIKARSPGFYDEIARGYKSACRWEGDLIGKMRFKGVLAVSKEWESSAVEGHERQRLGYGHFGMFGAQMVVKEVVSYESVVKEEEELKASDEKAAQQGARDQRRVITPRIWEVTHDRASPARRVSAKALDKKRCKTQANQNGVRQESSRTISPSDGFSGSWTSS